MTAVYRTSEHGLLEEELDEAKKDLEASKAKIEKLKKTISILKGGLHPYDRELHTKQKCPVCRWAHYEKAKRIKIDGTTEETLTIVSIRKIEYEMKWFSQDIPEHLRLECENCGAVHRMMMPPELL